MSTSDLHLDRLARRRAKAKIGWILHAAIYLTVNLGLVGLSFANGHRWALFPLFGWGFGLLMHGLAVWVFAPGSRVVERMVQHERAKMARDNIGP